MLAVFLYIVPAVLIRYLFLGKPMNRGPAIGVSVLLLFAIYVTTIFLWKLSGETSPSQVGRSLPWVLAASVWGYFILRANSREQLTSNKISFSQQQTKPSPKPLDSEDLSPVLEPKKEPAEKPAPNSAEQPKKKEPVITEKQLMSSAHDDEKFYEQVATELQDGNTKQGLWLKAETKARGDKDKARLLYIEWRVQQLTEEAEKAKAWEELLEAEAQAKKEREEEEARLAYLNRKITSREEAEDCIAPIKPFGYRLLGGVDDGELKWHIHSPMPLEPKNVPQDKLAKFVDEVLSNQEVQPNPKAEYCPKCKSLMREVNKGEWKCDDC